LVYLTFRIEQGYRQSDQLSIIRWSGVHKNVVSIVSGRTSITFFKKKDEFTDRMLERVVDPGLDAMGVERSRRLTVAADRSLGLQQSGLPVLYSNNTLILPDTSITLFAVSKAGTSPSKAVVHSLRQ
jgi:hypothetical protein